MWTIKQRLCSMSKKCSISLCCPNIKSWNQLPASLLASFLCKLNTFRKRVKNVVTSKGIEVVVECI